MRLSAASLVVLLLLPGLVRARVLAEAGPLSLGDGGSDALPAPEAQGLRASLELPFTLSQSAEVQAQAEGLRHLHDNPDAAPEAFIDDQYLGPLLVAHGSTWRSSRALQLGPGPHTFILRNAAVADAEDFVLKRIFVYATGPAGPAPAPQAAAKALPSPTAENGCSWRQTRDWPAKLKGGLTLSVINGHQIGSGELVRLMPGDAWECYLKLPAGPNSDALALTEGLRAPQKGPGLCSWVFSLDLAPPPFGAKDDYYRPGHWERARVKFCDGRFKLQYAQAAPLDIPWPYEELRLEIAAQDVEIGLRPAH